MALRTPKERNSILKLFLLNISILCHFPLIFFKPKYCLKLGYVGHGFTGIILALIKSY